MSMSLNEVNRELEILLDRIKRVKLEERTRLLGREVGAGENLSDILYEIESLRQVAQDSNNVIAKKNKTQDVRTFENFTAVYKAVKLRADTLRDAGKMHHNINSDDSIETRVMEAYKGFRANIEPKKLAMLEEFKDKYSEAELIRVKQEVADSYVSKIEQNDREMEEADSFLRSISKDEITRFKKNDNIIKAIEQIEKAEKKIEEAEAKLTTLRTPTDDVEIANQNQIIANSKTKIAAAQAILNSCEVLEAPQIIDRDGNVNVDAIKNISSTYKVAAKQERKEAGNNLLQNIERYYNGHTDSIQAVKRIELYIGRELPDKFSKVTLAQLNKIVDNLLNVEKNIDRKSTENHKFRRKIDEIEAFIKSQEKGQVVEKTGGTSIPVYSFKTPKEYRDTGVALDETYREKGFLEKRRMREEYILSILPQDMPFRRLRALFGSLSSRAGYALSEAKKTKEIQYRRKEEAFQIALKQKGMSTESARVVGMKEVRTDKLSGKRKAQMEER